MSKLFQAFLTGIFFTFIFDFFIFLGIKLNYIDYYEIDLYYNILFADNQNIFLFSTISIVVGFVVIYLNSNKISAILLSLLFLVATSTLIHPIGEQLGEMILMKKNITYKDSKHTYTGNTYYEGRDKITFYDYELKKVIILNKKELK